MRSLGAVLLLGVVIQSVSAFWGNFGDFSNVLPAPTAPVLPTVTDPADPPIEFKRVTTFEWVYDDSGTGANDDLGIYRPTTTQHGYYAVGDVAGNYHGTPSNSAIMVRERLAQALAAPSGFTEIWNDRGSGGSHDVRIMRMDPPLGYVCVGYVAVLGYGSTPDANKYRCVHQNYVSTTGRYEATWLDHGSGADADVGVYANRRSDADTYALDANAFTAFATHAAPTGSAPMLNGHHVINHLLVPAGNLDQFVLTVFQSSAAVVDEVWNDRGSGANRDISVWRSRGTTGTYSLGDLAHDTYAEPGESFVAKEVNGKTALAPAVGWTRIWHDGGSGADWDGAFWRPMCPNGYIGLGHVGMRNHWEQPPAADFRCVKAEYTVAGDWDYVWNDAGSGADSDLTIWRAVAKDSPPGQGVNAISSIAHHGGMNVGAHVLNPVYVNYVVGKPAKKYILSNIVYACGNTEGSEEERRACTPSSSPEPEGLARTVVTNTGNTPQTTTRTISYTKEETFSWGNTVGLEVGVTTEVSGGFPGVSSASVSVSVTASYSHEWGGSQTKSTTDEISVDITVPARSKKAAIITGSRYTADVPYTATLVTEYTDGTSSTTHGFKGVFHGVQINEINVSYNDLPL